LYSAFFKVLLQALSTWSMEAVLRVSSDSRREAIMGALSDTGVEAARPEPVVAAPAKEPPRETGSPREPSVDNREDGRRRRFLLTLLRALAAWCT